MLRRTLKRLAWAAVPIMLVAIIVATPAQADPTLPGITNGDFANYSGTTPGTGGDNFQNVNPSGWTGGGGLIFVTNYAGVNNSGLYLPVYNTLSSTGQSGPFPNSPIGGNFVEADGNPAYENSFSYQLHGLTPGTTYQLSFFQAAGQQQGFHGDTTNQWIVGLGTTGFNVTYANNSGFYHMADPNASVVQTPLMSVPTGTYVPWQEVTVTLTADNANDLLTFLAWGDNGSTVNLPPIAFLDIANNGNPVGSPVPEPASLTLLATGLLGIGAYRLRRRRSNLATA